MNDFRSKTPRRRAERRASASTVVLALVFVVLGACVYMLGTKAPPSSPWTAEAAVRLPADMTDQDEAAAQILAETNLRRAIRPGRDTTDYVASMREQLQVRVSANPRSDSSDAEVCIQYTSKDAPRLALAVVNRLAEQYAQAIRQQQKAEADRACREAEQATAKAETQLAEAQDRFDAFVRESLGPNRQPTASQTDDSDDQAESKPAGSKINPEWQAARRQLDHARAYRDQLLVDLTPLHPKVRAADEELADLEKRLAAIPHELAPEQGNLAGELRQMTDPLPETPGLIGPAAEDVDVLDQPLGRFVPPTVAAKQPAPPTARDARKRIEKFTALKRDVDAARATYNRAVAHQSEVWRRQFALPPVEVVAARAATAPAVAAERPGRLTLVALMVAMTGAAGVGMVVSGIGGSATFADAAQARAALAVPVLATIPAAGHARPGVRRRRLFENAVVIAGGLFLLVVCAAVGLATVGIAAWF
ncbi:MAG: hypothetical protein JW719_00700 [Pirellulales bacterium]|nr:hypothetical protein [Pirellulales bacterium]